MTTLTRQRASQRRMVFDAVSWREYELIGLAFQDRPIKITYDRGRMEIRTLFSMHKSLKNLLGQLIVLLALELDVSFRGFGSMTFKRRIRKRGLEPDECYWIQNEAAVRDTDQVDLVSMPPPDLVLEVEISRSALPRMSLYADLGVPEVWRFDGQQLRACHLEEGHYVERDRSLAFPFFNPAALVAFWLRRHEGEAKVLRDFQIWVREQIAASWPNGGLAAAT